MRNVIFNIGLAAVVLMLCFAAAELTSRAVYTKPWYDGLLEAQVADFHAAEGRRNSIGTRDQDYSPTKPADTLRVLILGDSFTQGYGVKDDAMVFAELLESSLNREFSRRGMKVEILNGGLGGSLTSAWVELLEKVKDRFRPDVILTVLSLRDGTRLSTKTVFFDPIREEIALRNQQSRLYRNSYLYRLYKDSLDRNDISDRYSEALIAGYLGDEAQTEEWRIAQSNLRKIQSAAKDLNAEYGLVVFPTLGELNERYPFKPICDVFMRFAAENKMPAHNLLPDFLGKDASTLWVAPLNPHPNERAHQIAAASMLPFLRELLLKKQSGALQGAPSAAMN